MATNNKVPVLILETKEPIQGYWDGGSKSMFKFEPELRQDKKGIYVKWGSWGANFWYTCGFGRSWKHAASIGEKVLRGKFIKRVEYTIRVEWQDNRGQFGNPS